MSDYDEYNYTDEEIDLYEEQLKEEENFDNWYKTISQEVEEFQSSAPFNTFQLLSVDNYVKLMDGEYKSSKRLPMTYEEKNQELEIEFPKYDFWMPIEKTKEEIINSKKGWIYFDYENPPCEKCEICIKNKTNKNKTKSRGRRRGRKCPNRGKMVHKPLYPELFEKPRQKVEKPKEKSKFEKLAEEKHQKLKKTGNAWGEVKNDDINFEEVTKQALLEQQKHKEEELRKKREEEERKKRAEQEKIRREEEHQRAQEEREYYQRKKEEQRQKRRKEIMRRNRGTDKPNSRFSNLW